MTTAYQTPAHLARGQGTKNGESFFFNDFKHLRGMIDFYLKKLVIFL